MVRVEHAEPRAASSPDPALRAAARGKQNRLLRALILTFYLPVLFVARWTLTLTRLHGEARRISIAQSEIVLPNLPSSFDGLRVAFLTDFHCSAQTPVWFLEQAVTATNQLAPDVILLGGDYISEANDYVLPISNILQKLRAPLGVYGVMGNHDFDTDINEVRAALYRAGVGELDNSGRWLWRAGSRIRIAGVGDLWEDDQNLHAALGDAGPRDTVILLSHNPDYAMQITDTRVHLVLSGHTHGGQINLPRIGTVISNSRYGKRLVSGLVPFKTLQLYVSRGLGTVMVPFRFNCPPEITLLTLRTTHNLS